MRAHTRKPRTQHPHPHTCCVRSQCVDAVAAAACREHEDVHLREPSPAVIVAWQGPCTQYRAKCTYRMTPCTPCTRTRTRASTSPEKRCCHRCLALTDACMCVRMQARARNYSRGERACVCVRACADACADLALASTRAETHRNSREARARSAHVPAQAHTNTRMHACKHARTTLLPPKPTEQQRARTHTHTLSRDKPGPGQSSRTNWRTGKRKSPAPSNPWPPAWQRTRRELRVGAIVLSSAAQCEGAPLPAPRDTAPGCPPGASRCRLAAGSPVCVPTNASTGQCSVVVHTASTAAHLMVSSGSVSLVASPSCPRHQPSAWLGAPTAFGCPKLRRKKIR